LTIVAVGPIVREVDVNFDMWGSRREFWVDETNMPSCSLYSSLHHPMCFDGFCSDGFCTSSELHTIAFALPQDGGQAVVVINCGDTAVPFALAFGAAVFYVQNTAPPHSIQTYVVNN
jgi:hypothetical protein